MSDRTPRWVGSGPQPGGTVHADQDVEGGDRVQASRLPLESPSLTVEAACRGQLDLADADTVDRLAVAPSEPGQPGQPGGPVAVVPTRRALGFAAVSGEGAPGAGAGTGSEPAPAPEPPRTWGSLTEERERIARDLHDTVVQRLFAVGLGLHGVIGRVEDPEVVARLRATIEDIDIAIREIRTTIFSLTPGYRGQQSLRARILDVVRAAGRALGFQPRVRVDGPVDSCVPTEMADDVLQTLREALSNVARHAHATRVIVDVAVHDTLALDVVDNGVGLPPGHGRGGMGLDNMQERAHRHGGRLVLEAAAGGGTHLHWAVPLRR